MPKIDRIGSTATKKLTYVGEDGALHYFYDENHNTIPYDHLVSTHNIIFYRIIIK